MVVPNAARQLATAPVRVLVVDDDELVREQLTAFLELAGYDVATAQSATQALHELERTSCQIVIADGEMADMDGPTLCRNIRESQRGTYIYVLLFTTCRDDRTVASELASGADDYIIKGTPIPELIARLESARCVLARGGLSSIPPLAGTVSRRAAQSSDQFLRDQWIELAAALTRQFEACRAAGVPLSVLLCVPDNVIGLGARLGPNASAELFARLRADIPKHLLESEWVAHYGCEGFIVVLPDVAIEAARLLASKIRAAVGAAGADILGGTEVIPLTASIGLATIQSAHNYQGLRPTDLLLASEQCLAHSRNRGGNRVTFTRMVQPS